MPDVLDLTTRRRRRPVLAAAVAVLLLTAGCQAADQPATPPGAPTDFATNAAGQTYGSAMGASGRDDEPDLIRVQATNGKEGYVLKDDLYGGDAEPATPEEAVAYQAARDTAAVQAAYAVVDQELGTSTDVTGIDTAAASEVVMDVRTALATGTLATDGSQLLRDLLATGNGGATPPGVVEPQGQGLTDLLTEVVLDADRATVRTVPVYADDGVTLVGEFEIG
jgi:hypothetical protein